MSSIPLLLLLLPVQVARTIEPAPSQGAPDEAVPSEPSPVEPVDENEFAVPEFQESAVPS